MAQADGFDESQWELLSTGYIAPWESGRAYDAGVAVTRGRLLLRCTAAHTSGSFDADRTNWQTVATQGAVLAAWQPNTEYGAGEAALHEDAICCCNTLHTSRAAYDAIEAAWWDVAARTKVLLRDWAEDTDYKQDEIVTKAGRIYRCLAGHNSEGRFKSVYWEPLDGGDAAGMQQYEAMGITAPLHVDLPVQYTADYRRPQPEVLKYNPESGVQDQVITGQRFDDGEDFIVDGESAVYSPYFVFDKAAKLNTTYKVKTEKTEAIDESTVCETEYIDFGQWKKIEQIRGGFF